jgi:hypothetical protein
MAEAGMILRVQIGYGVHGTPISGQHDRDEMGVCLEPPEFVTGLAQVPSGIDAQGPVGTVRRACRAVLGVASDPAAGQAGRPGRQGREV